MENLMASMNPEILQVALDYLARGFSVIPCKPDKKPFIKWEGYQKQRATPEEVGEWWSKWPSAMIGIVTGAISGVSVIDVDESQGHEELQKCIPDSLLMPTVKTPSGGQHLYFKCPNPAPGNNARIIPGCDFRGEGGYIIAPPSVNGTGQAYSWLPGLSLLDVDLPELPVGYVERIKKGGNGAKKIDLRPLYQGVAQGGRNDALARLAGSWVNDRLTLEECMQQAEIWNQKNSPSLPEREVEETIKKIFEKHHRKKEKTLFIESGINLTDLGNARRFVTAHGRDLRFCYSWGKWLAWDGKRWKVDDRGVVIRKAKETIMAIYQEAAKTQDESQRKDLAKHGLKSEAEGKILAMIGLAESEPGIPIVPDDMDGNPWLLNVANGTLDLKNGELLLHTRENLLTKISPVEYRPETTCLFWQDHLKRIFQGNENLISFIQIALGYSLTGIIDERAMFICYGRGSNGKSTTVEIFADLLGDYAIRTPTESILIKREGAIPNDLAKLKGARFVYCSETEEGKRLAESLIKDLTGGDTISARFMRGEWFTFRPGFKLWLSTNHRPTVRGTDDAIWSRLRLIPFNFQFPEEERLPRSRLWEKITPELPGILAWAVQGLKDWRQFGLFQPAEIREATQGYRSEMDILGKFFEEKCRIKKRAEVTAKELYSAYSKWCEENGERGVSQRIFSARLTEKGFQNQRTRAGYVWLGIGLDEGEICEPREPREPNLHIIRENSNI